MCAPCVWLHASVVQWRAKRALVYKTAPVPAVFVSQPLKFHVCCRGLGWSLATIQPQLSAKKMVFLYLHWIGCGAAAQRLGAAAQHSRNTKKPSWAFHAGLFVALVTRFTGLSFVLRRLRVQEDALWVSDEPCTCQTHRCPFVHHPYKVEAFVLFCFFPSSKQQDCLLMEFFYLQSGTRMSSSIQRACWCLQACGTRLACLSHTRCLLKPLPRLSTTRARSHPEPPSFFISAPLYISVALHFFMCVGKWHAQALRKPKKRTKDCCGCYSGWPFTRVSCPNETEKQKNRTHAVSQTRQRR